MRKSIRLGLLAFVFIAGCLQPDIPDPEPISTLSQETDIAVQVYRELMAETYLECKELIDNGELDTDAKMDSWLEEHTKDARMRAFYKPMQTTQNRLGKGNWSSMAASEVCLEVANGFSQQY